MRKTRTPHSNNGGKSGPQEFQRVSKLVSCVRTYHLPRSSQISASSFFSFSYVLREYYLKLSSGYLEPFQLTADLSLKEIIKMKKRMTSKEILGMPEGDGNVGCRRWVCNTLQIRGICWNHLCSKFESVSWISKSEDGTYHSLNNSW